MGGRGAEGRGAGGEGGRAAAPGGGTSRQARNEHGSRQHGRRPGRAERERRAAAAAREQQRQEAEQARSSTARKPKRGGWLRSGGWRRRSCRPRPSKLRSRRSSGCCTTATVIWPRTAAGLRRRSTRRGRKRSWPRCSGRWQPRSTRTGWMARARRSTCPSPRAAGGVRAAPPGRRARGDRVPVRQDQGRDPARSRARKRRSASCTSS